MVFVLNKQGKIIAVLGNTGINMTPLLEDVLSQSLDTGSETFNFSTIFNSKTSKDIIVGNYVAFLDKKRKYKLFQIVQVEEIHGNELEIDVYCESAGLSLINDVARATILLSCDIRRFMEYLLLDTEWSVGFIDTSLRAVYDLELETASVYSLMQNNVGKFSGELNFRVEIENGVVTGKFIDVFAKKGRDNGQRYEFGKNVNSIKRKIDSTSLHTALIGVGKNNLNFQNTVLEGIPKPVGQDWVGDSEAFNLYNHNGHHLMGVFKFETESPEELLRETFKKLQETKKPKIEYEVDVALLGEDVEVGDTVRIIDRYFNPPLLLSARINKKETSLTNPNGDKVTLSNFIEVGSGINGDILGQIKDLVDNSISDKFPVTNENIAEGAVTGDKIYENSIATDHLMASSITAGKIQSDSIQSNHISANQIESGHIKAGTIVAENIQTGTITAESAIIADAAIGTAQIQDASINNAKIKDLSADKITAGTIDANKINVTNLNADNITSGTINSNIINVSDSTNLANLVNQKDVEKTHLIDLRDNRISTDLPATDLETGNEFQFEAMVKTYNNTTTKNLNAMIIVTYEDGSADWFIRTLGIANECRSWEKRSINVDVKLNPGKIAKYFGLFLQIDEMPPDSSSENWIAKQIVVRKKTNGKLIVDGTITANKIKAGTITADKIAADTITGDKIHGGTITGDKIQGGTIIGDNISGGTITGDKISGDTITGNNIAAGSITADEIAAGTITGDKISGDTITGDKITGNTITGDKIKAGSITAENIEAGTITGDKITGNTITGNKIAGNTIVGNNIAGETITGDKITGNTITGDKISGDTITGDKIKAGSITADKIAADAINANHIAAGTITAGEIAADTIEAIEVSASQVTADKIASGEIKVGNANIVDGTISGAKISSASISNAQIADATIDSAKIKELNASLIKTGTLDCGNLDVRNLNADSITAGSITIQGKQHLYNSIWLKDTSCWAFETGWSRQPSIGFEDAVAFKCEQTSQTADHWRLLRGGYNKDGSFSIDAKKGESWVYSVWTHSPNVASIDSGAYMEMEEWDAKGNRIEFRGIGIIPRVSGTWERFVYTTEIKNPLTVKTTLRFHIVRNGLLYIAKPMISRGSLASIHTLHTDELISNGAIDEDKISNGAVNSDKLNIQELFVGDNAFINSLKAVEIDASRITTGKINSERLDITGLVSFEAFDPSLKPVFDVQGDKTYINGGMLATNSISANKIQANAITSDNIKANTITSDKLKVDELFVGDNAFINSLKAVEISAEQITTGKINSERLDITGLVSFEAFNQDLKPIFDTSGDKTYINGGMIATNSIKAEKIDVKGLTVKNKKNDITLAVSDEGDIKVNGLLQSVNFNEEMLTGYKIDVDGTAVFNQATIRGDITLPNAGMTNYGALIGKENLLRNTRYMSNLEHWGNAGSQGILSIINSNFLKEPVIKCENRTSGEVFLEQSLNINIANDTMFTFSCDMYIEQNISSIEVYFIGYNSNGDMIYAQPVEYNLPKETWFELSASKVIPKDVKRFSIRLDNNGYIGSPGQGFNAFLITKIKLESGEKTPWSPSPKDQHDYVRLWAGSDFSSRNNAPFRVTQAGNLWATNATISGRLIGNIDAGRVHIHEDMVVINRDISVLKNGKVLENKHANQNPFVKFSPTQSLVDTDFIFGSVGDTRIKYLNDNRELQFNRTILNMKGSANDFVKVGLDVPCGYEVLNTHGHSGGSHRVKYANNYGGMIFDSFGSTNAANGENPFDFKFERNSSQNSVNVKIAGNIEIENAIRASNQNIEMRAVAGEGWGYYST